MFRKLNQRKETSKRASDNQASDNQANLNSLYYLEYSMSAFNPETYLDSTISEPTVRRPPLPATRDFVGVIGEIKSRAWQGKKDPTQSGIAVDVPIEFDLSPFPDLVAQIGQPKVTLMDGIMLDLTSSGAIDNAPGKNSKLRRYREALDMNKPGDSFSFRAMQGRLIRAKIKHETFEGDVLDKIDSVAKA